MREAILQTLMGALGALGFALVFNAQKRYLIYCFIGGLIGWGMHCIAGVWIHHEAIQYLVATTALTIYAESIARILRCPSTIILVTGWIPLIPGGALYRSIHTLVAGQRQEFVDQTLHTVLLMVAMSAGVLLGMTCMQLFLQTKEKIKKKQ